MMSVGEKNPAQPGRIICILYMQPLNPCGLQKKGNEEPGA
jgi:hypothetical protein